MMQDEAIAKILQNGTSLTQMAAELVASANESGGRDNITVLLTQASGAVEKRGFVSRLLGK
jgi:protein phosphatase